MADTGNQATLALATTGAVGNIRNIGELAAELAKLEDSHLGTSDQKTFMPDDLEDPGEFEVEVEFEAHLALPARGVVETITVTFPQRVGDTAAANLAGTGFIRRVATPQLINGQIQVMKILIAMNGKTGPTFTVATTTT